MKKWEYKYLIDHRAVDLQVLDEMGEEGWELVGYEIETGSIFGGNRTIYIFKRELKD